jgi:hypothetical protein
MKKIMISALFLIVLLQIACTKKQSIYKPQNYEAVNNAVLNYQTLYDIFYFSNLAASSGTVSTNTCLSITKDSAVNRKTYHLNFGNSPCVYTDNRKRSGNIDVNATKTYPQKDSLFTITLKDYKINGYLLNGTIYYKFLNISSNSYISIISNNITLEAMGNNYNLSLNCTLYNTTNYGYLKGVFKATGNDITYETQTLDSLGINNKYFATYNYYSSNKPFYIKGKAIVVTNDFNAELNYGNFEEDDYATATSNDFRFIIDLKKY